MNTLWWTRSLLYHSSMCALCRWRRLRLLCAGIHCQNNSKCLQRQNWGSLTDLSSFHVKRLCLFQTIWMLGCTYCVDVLLAWLCPDARHLWSCCQKAFQKDHHHYHQTQKNLFTLINKISSLAMLVVVREEFKIKWRITGWESFEVSSLKRLFTIWLVAGFTTLVGI